MLSQNPAKLQTFIHHYQKTHTIMSSDWSDLFSRHTRTTFSRPSYSDDIRPPFRTGGLSGYTTGSSDRFTTGSIDVSKIARKYPVRGRNRGKNRAATTHRVDRSPEPELEEPNPFDISDKFDTLGFIDNDSEKLGFIENENLGLDIDDCEAIPVQSSGENVPNHVSTFDEIDLGKGLNENIRRCKYANPTAIQRHAIPVVVAGRDLMACAQTGSGKTAAFCLPIVSGILRLKQTVLGSLFVFGGDDEVACPIALILSPTRELSCQIHDEAKKFAYQTGVKVVVAYGGAPIERQFRNLERGVDILVATPGRLVDMIQRKRVSLRKLKYLVLDEADRMLDMGFEPQIRKIVEQLDMPRTGVRQTMLVSATFPDEIQKLASDFLSNYIFLSVGRVGSSTDRIAQRVEYVEDTDKRDKLINILQAQKETETNGKHTLILVFVETKKGADALEHCLFRNGFSATAIHGNKMQMERERALRSFRSGETPIMVATDVAARGLDISHVSHVINFDFPKSIDDYVHRIGRTGRAGKSGTATAFFNEGDSGLAKPLVELMHETKQEVPEWLSEYAAKSLSSCFGSSDRANRYRGSKFGGHDYRCADDNALSVNLLADGTLGYPVDIVATGWD